MGDHSSEYFRARDYLHPRFWPMWLVFAGLRLVCLLPYRGALQVGRLLGRTLFLVAGSRQHIVDTNLARCFPEKSIEERDRIKIECYRNLGISLIEVGMCWWWSADRLRPLVEIEGREHLDAVLASGRGAILLTGHYTSLEIGGRLLTLFMPLQGMYRTQRNRMFDSYLYTRRHSYLVDIVSRKNTRQLVRGIRKQVPTWYAPDQDFRRERNVFAPFMGIAAATISASSRLAQASNAVMLPYYPERKQDGSGYLLHIGAPLQDVPSDDEVADATAINQSIENWVRKFPQNYMWINQRFRTRPPGEPPFYP
jgi:Kdo2-lipid IVA lauroyltransferase/acyltransferase